MWEREGSASEHPTPHLQVPLSYQSPLVTRSRESGKLDLMTVDRKLRVGVLMPLKKWTKHAFAHSSQIDFLHLQPADVTATYLTSLSLDFLLHKVGDLLLEPAQLALVREEVARWGGPVVDDFERVQVLSDRRLICSLLLHLEEDQRKSRQQETSKDKDDDIIRLPPTVGTLVNQIHWCSQWEKDKNGAAVLEEKKNDKDKENKGTNRQDKGSNISTTCVTSPSQDALSPSTITLTDATWMVQPVTVRSPMTPTHMNFPIIRKPVAACSVEDSHLMCILYSPDQAMMDSGNEFILQEFIPHGGVIYKIYVIGQEQRIQVRPSLPTHWLEPASQSRPFDSQSLKRLGAAVNIAETMQRLTPEHLEQIRQYTDLLRKHLGLTLFGWDLIMEKDSDRLFIIDVNYFPGYDEVDFMALLTEHLEQGLVAMTTAKITHDNGKGGCLPLSPS